MLTRRSSLLLPMLLAACGGKPTKREFPPLHYSYLAPLALNVAAIQVEQRYVPSGAPPDVSQYDPMPPVLALRNMVEDRLQALGSAGQAVFVIQNASLIQREDTIIGNFAVELNVFAAPGARAGYAQASVSATISGHLDDLPGRLYDMTKDMMDRMNVEFEYQVRRSLRRWLLTPGVVQPPVVQTPLPTMPSEVPPPPPPAPKL